MAARKQLTLGHSPDPDDAFMFYGLAAGRVETRGWTFSHELQDIQTLNDRATRGELDVSAISIHAYPFVADKYAMMNCGCSMGDGYGPMVVSRDSFSAQDLKGRTIAVPGVRTTAFLALNLLLGRGSFQHRVVAFDHILEEVALGRADAGLIIHEGQLTYERHRLHKVVDLGEWWKRSTRMPLPLGGNAVKRELGWTAMEEVTGIVAGSIRYGLSHREEAVEYALRYGRDLSRPLTDRFVGMYVNEWTLDYGDAGRRAVRELLRRGADAGLTPPLADVDFVGV